MMPWQNRLAILAIGIASVTLLPISPVWRITAAAAGGAMIVALLVSRVAQHGKARAKRPDLEATYDRIDRIREQRANRYRR